jgi:hypothetical protein
VKGFGEERSGENIYGKKPIKWVGRNEGVGGK